MSPLHVARALIVALALLAYAPAILFGDLQHLNVEDDVHLPRGRPATLGAALRWCAFEAPRLGTAGPLGACLQVAVNWVGASAAAARVASLACHLWVAVSSLGLCYRLGDDALARGGRRPARRRAPAPRPGRRLGAHLPALAAAGFALEAAHKALDGRSAPPPPSARDRPPPAAAAAASGDAAARLLVVEGWRDALAAAAWYAWSLAAPPDNPPGAEAGHGGALAAYASPLALYTAATSANPGDFESWAALGHATKEDPTKDDNDTDLATKSLSYYSRAMEAGAGEKPCGIAEVMTQYLGSNLDAAACWERRAGSDRPAARGSEQPRARAEPGSLRRLKILRDINEGDPTIAKIVADFEARRRR
ncbi:ribosome biogenesis factor [Aureococcus anophagefferens]|uniref:Ribosome biogenesis factor n=1 Tax=Aureococcus anophagefferens TaxID=44056 RepID=A0ABR1GB52_AURAN